MSSHYQRRAAFVKHLGKILKYTMIYYILLLISVLCLTEAKNGPPVVKTPYGKIEGTLFSSYKGATYSQFLGIPYAQPPVGKLRFREPQPLKKWIGVWNANTSTECIQINHGPEPEGGNLIGDEDCLYINVFVPSKKPREVNMLDVIVHIHGGAFNFGYGNNYAGPKYLMDINVILVTFNYRLGPLGFLSTEDEVVPGNNGMKDQVAALKWIKENIKYFGGNPESITITGLSAGGASVHYHYLSPLSKGLFKGGISVSGTALCPWTLQEAPLEKAKSLGVAVGCSQKSSNDLVNCLRQRSARQIVQSMRILRPWLYNPFSPFGIVVEKTGEAPFLPDNPYVLLLKGQVQDLPWITSVTSDEGLYPAADYAVKDNYLSDLEKRWEELAPYVLDYKYTLPSELHRIVAKKAKDYYLKGKAISKQTFSQLIQMIGDRHFVVDSERAARLQAKANKSPVYYYYFSYPGEKVSTFAVYYTLSEEKYGVCHGDDIMYILSNPTRPATKMTKSDENMKDILLKIWSTFASTGTPKIENLNWTIVSGDNSKPLDYVHIKAPNEVFLTTSDEIGHRSFWESIPFQESQNLLNNEKDEL